MIILAGVKVLSGCVDELSERAVDRKTVEHIEQIIQSEPRIRSWHRLRTRSLGREIFIDMHILVDPELNITQAHEISDSLEQHFHDKMPQPVNVIVHIEPDIPTLRQ
jgi:divalent metal cation (Fe/Co/Zn/Cd) transporter